MQAASFTVFGEKNTIEELHLAMLQESKTAQLQISCPSAQGSLALAHSERVRQIEMADVLFSFAIHVPAGVTAHMLYDWVKNWLKSRAGEARVIEHPPSPIEKPE